MNCVEWQKYHTLLSRFSTGERSARSIALAIDVLRSHSTPNSFALEAVMVLQERATWGGYFRPAPSQQSGDGALAAVLPRVTAPSIDRFATICSRCTWADFAQTGNYWVPDLWLNFTSWIMSSGEWSTKCHEHSLPTTCMNLVLKAARPTPESMGIGHESGTCFPGSRRRSSLTPWAGRESACPCCSWRVSSYA